ncbi:hypothetical protein WJX84_010964 [Apatococcus fuscideae]|uniref:Uncharacterized protein n=1 Tax=Apatococcus fuscideae TaxID=2026836 RepID=A0AAW1SPT7_9CHLO
MTNSTTTGQPHKAAVGTAVPQHALSEASMRLLAERMSIMDTSPRKRKGPEHVLREPVLGSTVLSLPQDGQHNHTTQMGEHRNPVRFTRLHANVRPGLQQVTRSHLLSTSSVTSDTASAAAQKAAAGSATTRRARVMTQQDRALPPAHGNLQLGSRQRAAASAVDWSEYWPPNAIKRKAQAQRQPPQGSNPKPSSDLEAIVPFFTQPNHGPSRQLPVHDASCDHLVPEKAGPCQPGNNVSVPSGLPAPQASRTPHAIHAGVKNKGLLPNPSLSEQSSMPHRQPTQRLCQMESGGGTRDRNAAAAAFQLDQLLNVPRELWGSLGSLSGKHGLHDVHGFTASQAGPLSATAPDLQPAAAAVDVAPHHFLCNERFGDASPQVSIRSHAHVGYLL